MAALVVAGAVAAGCGGGNDAPEFEGSDEEQIAATVETVDRAMAAGDGAAACPLISDEGQELLVRIVRRELDGVEIDGCEEAIARLGETRYESGFVSHSPARVYRDQDDSDHAEISCDDERNVWTMGRMDDGWRVVTPFCHD